jgi:hypothetical protein
MKIRYAIAMTLALGLLPASSVWATVYRTVTSGTYSWEDPAAWEGGVQPDDDIPNHDSVIIRTEIVLMTHLGVKPNGTLVITDTFTIYSPEGEGVREAKGLVRVDGVLRILAGQDGDANALVIKGGNGRLEVNGLVENLGAELINEGTVNVGPGGTLRNFGYRDATDDDLVRADNGEVYDLDHFASNLVGYENDDDHLPGHTGGPNATGVQDTLSFAGVAWTCYAGLLDNRGDVVVQPGGIVDDSACGGGIVMGDDLSPGCHAPSGLRISGSNATGLTFSWDPVQAAHSYFIGLKPLGAPRYRIVRPVTGGATSYRFPAGFFPTGVQAEWAVLTVCEPGSVDLAYLSTSQATLQRQAAMGIYTDQRIRTYPNPASERLHVETTSPVGEGMLTLIDVKGRKVLETPLASASGERVHEVSLEGIDEGLYVVQVIQGGDVHQETVWVSR